MPHATSFEFGSIPLGSLNDGESMADSTMTEYSRKEYFSRCLWYGEQFHRCVVAEGLFSNAAENTLGEALEAARMQTIIDFPYADCIEYVDGIKAIDVPGDIAKPYSMLMAKIGAVLDQGDAGARHKLAIMIQNRGGTGSSVLHNDKKMPPPPPSAEDLAMDDDKHIAMYTMKLNEWSQRKGKSLDFDDKHLSVDPPLWEVSLKVEGGLYVGKAKKRKRAQHIASKQACEELRIDM